MQGVARIPFAALKAYADEYDLSGYERDEFFRVIRALDNCYCMFVKSKQKPTGE